MADLPTVVTSAGLQPRSFTEIKETLLADVASTNPGYTANLPGILIEDISSTDTYAIAECDSARVDAVNSLTPVGANSFLLLQLGQMLGIPIGVGSNTSVFVVFSTNPPAPGLVIGKGFIVSDGNFQYTLVDGGTLDSDGNSDPLFAVATQSGSWAIPANTVNQLVTSVPPGITLVVTNPLTGIPGIDAETQASYRTRVLQGNLAASQGMARYLRTLLGKVSGVQPRLILPLMNPGGGWEIIVGGGDPYQVAYAVYTAIFDISTLVGSTLSITNITSALPAVVTTSLNHLLTSGSDIVISGVNTTDFNGSYVVNAIPTEKTFRLGKRYGLNAITAQSWTGGTITWTTTTPHGVTVGSTFRIAGSSPAGYSGTFVAISGTTGSTLKATAADPGATAVFGQLQPGIALFDSTALGPYVSGGVITPNPRNLTVSVQDYPDTYSFPIVIPPEQDVTIAITWDTSTTNIVSEAAVAQAVVPAIVAYINSIYVGQPINELQLESTFVAAVTGLLTPDIISALNFAVSINGVGTSLTMGTTLYQGDPESFFFATTAGISVTRI